MSEAQTQEQQSDAIDLRVLIGVGVFAFALRALYIAQAWSHPAVRIPVIDAEAYRARALQILEGDWLGDAVYYLDPLYPFFLDGVIQDPSLMLADGIHPTAEGIDIVVARLTDLVEAELAED